MSSLLNYSALYTESTCTISKYPAKFQEALGVLVKSEINLLFQIMYPAKFQEAFVFDVNKLQRSRKLG